MRAARYLATARRLHGVDRDLLAQMVVAVGRLEGSLVLCGWSDYAKHLVNFFGEGGGVLAIADEAPHRYGWTFRGVPVMPLADAVARHPDHFICTHIDDRVHYLSEVTAHADYANQPVHCFPSPAAANGRFVEPVKHSRFYRALHDGSARDQPDTMLTPARLQLMLETARQTLHLSGDVLELGAWQGGSAWALARLLVEARARKRLVLLDFFEQLPRHNPEGIMCLDEIRHWLSFYPSTEIHAGDVDRHPDPIASRQWCFIHYDAGFEPRRLAACFDQLQIGGIIVLDNYGHIAHNPGRFDHWFASRGHSVSLLPGTEQGWVLKHASDGRSEQPSS